MKEKRVVSGLWPDVEGGILPSESVWKIDASCAGHDARLYGSEDDRRYVPSLTQPLRKTERR